jgi:hypothetical protein
VPRAFYESREKEGIRGAGPRKREALADVGNWKVRRYLVAVVAGLSWLVLSGVPTNIIDTPLFTRMTPVEWWNYPFWLASAILIGLLAATYVVGPDRERSKGPQGKALGGGLLSVFAIGCPRQRTRWRRGCRSCLRRRGPALAADQGL